MRKAEIMLWIAAAVLAVAVVAVCLRSTPGPEPESGVYEAATLSLDEYGVVTFSVDLNAADQAELMRLPGMTEEIAQAIIAYRAYYGRFKNAQEVGHVAGVSEALCDRWQSYLIVDAETSR